MYQAALPIVLASASPRRKELLSLLGIDFEVVVSPADEPPPGAGEFPPAYAARMARIKAAAVAAMRPEAVVLGADSIVVLGEAILGKPADPADAVRMLSLLSGRTHHVITGCALFFPGREPEVFTVATAVTMAAIAPEAIAAYVATGEPLDKAGAYAIQGRAAGFVTGIEGSYTNVVGLPLDRVLALLVSWGALAPREAGCSSSERIPGSDTG